MSYDKANCKALRSYEEHLDFVISSTSNIMTSISNSRLLIHSAAFNRQIGGCNISMPGQKQMTTSLQWRFHENSPLKGNTKNGSMYCLVLIYKYLIKKFVRYKSTFLCVSTHVRSCEPHNVGCCSQIDNCGRNHQITVNKYSVGRLQLSTLLAVYNCSADCL